jgi:prolyl-tRNA synthetase
VEASEDDDEIEESSTDEEVDVLFKAVAANENSQKKSSNEYVLNSTHEELITPIAIEYGKSYKNFPFAYYQIQTKFRNEPRAKSGILRGREFRMKDLYSFHTSTEDFVQYYEKVKNAYLDFFKELGLEKDTYVTTASGGDFTEKLSHEFQVVCDAGEDTIYINPSTNTAYNQEVLEIELQNNNLKKEDLKEIKACEVGNIFTLVDRFTKDFNFTYKDENGENQLVKDMGCYGIGTTRVMGVIVEKYGDEKGLVWPKNIAPYEVEIVSLHKEEHDKVYDTAERIHLDIKETFETLWDDRLLSPGNKLADADLYGSPVQIILVKKVWLKVWLK